MNNWDRHFTRIINKTTEDIHFTREEDFLCLVPVIGVYIDIFATFLKAGYGSVLLAYEWNAWMKAHIESNFSVFLFMVKAPLIVFVLSICVVYLLKYLKYKREFQYAWAFTYFGMRCAGALTWLL